MGSANERQWGQMPNGAQVKTCEESQLCLLDGISNAHCMPIQKDSLDMRNRTSGITSVGAKLPSSSTCNIQRSEQNFTLSKYAFISPE
jgi:hypothetical protein